MYPKSKDGRSFPHEWLLRFPWLQYSIDRDATFCYACSSFQPFGSKEGAFMSVGYRNWKSAMDKEKGFPKHAASETHIRAMSLWNERERRLQSGLTVSTLLNDKVLENNR